MGRPGAQAIDARHRRQQQRESIPADPANGERRLEQRHQPARQLPQHLVAEAVAVQPVDVAQAVEIDHDQKQAAAGSAGSVEHARRGFAQPPGAEQAGEAVALGQGRRRGRLQAGPQQRYLPCHPQTERPGARIVLARISQMRELA